MKVLSVAGIVVAAYAAMCIAVFFMQRKMLFFPVPETDGAAAETLWLDSDGERLKVWRIPAQSKRAIIYFGGNAENVAWNAEDFRRWFPDYSIYLMNYRGYGGSSGTPTEQGLCQDSRQLYDSLVASYDSIAVIGRSLGSGVATCLAAAREVEKLVLITPFDSVVRVAQQLMPWLPISLLSRDPFDSLSRAAKIKAPVLIFIANQDDVIPPAHAHKLAETFPREQVTVLEIEGADHNNVQAFPAYSETLRDFLP